MYLFFSHSLSLFPRSSARLIIRILSRMVRGGWEKRGRLLQRGASYTSVAAPTSGLTFSTLYGRSAAVATRARRRAAPRRVVARIRSRVTCAFVGGCLECSWTCARARRRRRNALKFDVAPALSASTNRDPARALVKGETRREHRKSDQLTRRSEPVRHVKRARH